MHHGSVRRGAWMCDAPPMQQLLVALALALAACKGKAEPLPTKAEKTELANTACPRVTGAYFFEVTKDGRTSHILGTRHLGVGLDKFPASVRTALDAASLLVEEVAPGKHDKPEFKSEPLRDELGPKDWAHFEELVGAPVAKRLETMPSVVAALAAAMMFEDVTVMLDRQIEERAKAKAIPGEGLETSRFQLDMLTRLFDVKLLKSLVEETPSRAKLRQTTREGLERYCAGTDKDARMFDGVEDAQMLAHGYTRADLDRIEDELLYQRNTAWIPKLETIFERDHVFVAVGAGHLRGPRGVIELLRARGYAITRITN